jgi:hypothetical protein
VIVGSGWQLDVHRRALGRHNLDVIDVLLREVDHDAAVSQQKEAAHTLQMLLAGGRPRAPIRDVFGPLSAHQCAVQLVRTVAN